MEMEAVIRLAKSRFGNAGVMPLSPLQALKIDEWNRIIDVNIRGDLHGTAAGHPLITDTF